jgi:hypothetical protein
VKLLLPLLLAACATLAPSQPRSQPRSEPRDQAAQQRRAAPAGTTTRTAIARREFQRQHACPATGFTSGPCPGYIIDHVIALKRGGPDAPSNMQWQTTAEAKAKDRIE